VALRAVDSFQKGDFVEAIQRVRSGRWARCYNNCSGGCSGRVGAAWRVTGRSPLPAGGAGVRHHGWVSPPRTYIVLTVNCIDNYDIPESRMLSTC
jgi:hypothetical protein